MVSPVLVRQLPACLQKRELARHLLAVYAMRAGKTEDGQPESGEGRR